MPEEIVVTHDDHDDGYKDVDCELRAGGTVCLRVRALSHRAATRLLKRLASDPWLVLDQSVEDPAIIETLSPFAAAQMLGVACKLAFGDDCQTPDHAPAADVPQDDHSARRGELACIRIGFAAAEVRQWSFPKLRMWTALAEEQHARDVMLQAAAVLDPEQFQRMMQAQAPSATASETPRSQEDFERLTKDAQ